LSTIKKILLPALIIISSALVAMNTQIGASVKYFKNSVSSKIQQIKTT